MKLSVCTKATYVAVTLHLWLLTSIAVATPLKFDDVIGTPKWKCPITVYIPVDPNSTGKIHEDVKRAVDEWSKITANKGITITPVILDANGNVPGTGKPPDPKAKGSVVVSYKTQAGHASPQFEGEQVGTGKDGQPIIKDAQYTHGEIQIGTGAPAQAYVIALHEVGHILGLDHSKETDSVMQERVDDYEKLGKPGASDVREFDSVYSKSEGRIEGSAFALGEGGFQYAYTATWLSGGEIPLVDVVVLGSPIEKPEIPMGWQIVGFPFAEPRNIFSLRVDPTDELQAYLSADNPILTFSFISLGTPTTTVGWAGSEHPVQSVVGPIPEPSTLILVFTGAVAIVLGAWRRSKKAMAVL